MTREIKFRAWDKIRESWVYGDMPHGFFRSFYDGNPEHFGCIQQFTGLKDKNGKEIYGGDVVKWGEEEGLRAEVIWSENGQGWQPFIGAKTEIIGNIYENPDLIK